MNYFTVSTNGTGLVVREVRPTDTTAYSDRLVAVFDTPEEAKAFAEAHDEEYWEDPWE